MNCDSIIIDGRLYNYDYTSDNLHIDDSSTVSKRFFRQALSWMQQQHPSLNVWRRSMASLVREWATHNLLHGLGIAPQRTGAVDLNYPQKWYVRLAYDICGPIALIFIK